MKLLSNPLKFLLYKVDTDEYLKHIRINAIEKQKGNLK
jgi:hypothetical protein